MEARLDVLPAADERAEGSPLAAARLRRRLTLEEAAARARLDPSEVRLLEENRIYRFPSVENAVGAALIYAAALGVSEREARELAGLSPGPPAQWSLRRGLTALGLLAVFLTLLLVSLRAGVVPSPAEDDASRSAVAVQKLPPPWEIRVDVYNGTEVPNAAAFVANEVGGPLAYRLGTVENAKRSDYVETRVYYPPGSEEIAERLAGQLGVETTALPGGEDPNRLVVIVGRDMAVAPGRGD